MSIRNRHMIKKAVSKSRRTPLPWPALVGDGQGTIEVPGSPGLWYVRPVGSSLAIPVYKGSAPAMNNYPVWVGQDVYNRRWVRILGTNLEGMNSTVTIGGIIPFDVEPHGRSHYLTGSDPIYITTRQVVDLLLTVVSGMTVRIAGGFVIADGQPMYVIPQTVDLTSHIPTDAARWVVIRADSAGALDVQDGAEVDSFADLTVDTLPAVEAGYSPLWAVRLYDGQTAVNATSAQADFFDLRFAPRGPSPAGDVSADVTDFDGILSSADTTVQAALDTIDDHGMHAADVLVPAANVFYLGASDVDGTWRIARNGDDLEFARRESGSYVVKDTITAA